MRTPPQLCPATTVSRVARYILTPPRRLQPTARMAGWPPRPARLQSASRQRRSSGRMAAGFARVTEGAGRPCRGVQEQGQGQGQGRQRQRQQAGRRLRVPRHQRLEQQQEEPEVATWERGRTGATLTATQARPTGLVARSAELRLDSDVHWQQRRRRQEHPAIVATFR